MENTRVGKRKQLLLQKKKKKKQSMAGLTTMAMMSTPFVSQLGISTAFAEQQATSTQTFQTTEAFIASIAPSASQICHANDLYASVMIAQAILESNSGNSQLAEAPYYNLFGVKGTYQGQSVSFKTDEFIEGEWIRVDQPFRSYGSYWASLMDNANVLLTTSFGNGQYHYSGTWKRNTTSYLDATSWLTGTYATDPTYGDKLNQLIQTYNLTIYDTPTSLAPDQQSATGAASQTAIDTAASAAASQGKYTVVAGDNLWTIAQNFGMTLEELMEKNGLTSYDIYVGDVLNV
jgi:flagellum-specific peptidoglycan hydrolase FlgJ